MKKITYWIIGIIVLIIAIAWGCSDTDIIIRKNVKTQNDTTYRPRQVDEYVSDTLSPITFEILIEGWDEIEITTE